MEMNVAERHLKEGLEDAYDDRLMTIGRTAILTESKPEQSRQACHYCGPGPFKFVRYFGRPRVLSSIEDPGRSCRIDSNSPPVTDRGPRHHEHLRTWRMPAGHRMQKKS